MQAERRGGLSGKARKVHHRRRAARLHANQLIKEYFEPESSRAGGRQNVRISGRSDFLPSVAHIGNVSRKNNQLELPLEGKPKVQTPADDRVIRFKPKEHSTKSFDPRVLQPSTDAPRRFLRDFTFRGFFTGCAMGSAAAAMVLLVVHATFR